MRRPKVAGMTMVSQDVIEKVLKNPLPCAGEDIYSIDDIVIGENNPTSPRSKFRFFRNWLRNFQISLVHKDILHLPKVNRYHCTRKTNLQFVLLHGGNP